MVLRCDLVSQIYILDDLMKRVEYLSAITNTHNTCEDVDFKTEFVEMLTIRHGPNWKNVSKKLYPFLKLIRSKIEHEIRDIEKYQSVEMFMIHDISSDEEFSSDDEDDDDEFCEQFNQCFNDVIRLSKRLSEIDKE